MGYSRCRKLYQGRTLCTLIFRFFLLKIRIGSYGTPRIFARGVRNGAARRSARPCAISRKRVRGRVHVYVCTCGGEVWWLLACLPRLSGALPDRTLNPARLNLGIIRGYKPRSTPLSPVSRQLCSSPWPRPSPHPAIFRSQQYTQEERGPYSPANIL